MVLRLGIVFIIFTLKIASQDSINNAWYIDVNYFKGNIALHNNDILHLITGHPEGVILSWNKKTYGDEAWQARYNYPDYGASFIYQDLKNPNLGENFGLYAHFNFYFLKRTLQLRVAQGLAITTNPYDRIENPKNIAFGTKILSSTYLMLNYKTPRFFKHFEAQTGLSLIHYSNANVKAPNTSINTIALNLGLNYHFNSSNPEYKKLDSNTVNVTEPIKYNFVFRSGINQSDIIGSGQYPFYIISAYADKRLSHKSGVHIGSEVFFSNFLKEFIRYTFVAFPESNTNGNEDYKRVGVFAGHELFINKLSVLTQLGYYIYYPFDFEGRSYFRVGLNRYFGKNFLGSVTLKSHGAKAEAVEFGVGVRL